MVERHRAGAAHHQVDQDDHPQRALIEDHRIGEPVEQGAYGLLVGVVEAGTAFILPASLKYLGIYALYLIVVVVRPRGLFGSL